MLLLHIAYSEEDAAPHIQFAFGQSSHADCLNVFEIHRKKPHPVSPGRTYLKTPNGFQPQKGEKRRKDL